MNPALTGVMSSDIKYSGVVRNQWANVPVDYLSFSGELSAKLLEKTGQLSAGLIFQYDEAGDSELSQSKVDAIVAYNSPIAKGIYLSAAFQAGYGNRSFQTANLTFDSQFNGDVFDPSLSTQENFDQTSFGFFDLSAGLNIHIQQKGRLGYYTTGNVGIALHHLNSPRQSFLNDDSSKLGQKLTIYGYHNVILNKQFDLFIATYNTLQDESMEFLMGTGLKLHFNRKKNLEKSLDFYLYYRYGDAIIPSFVYRHQVWEVGLSYDWNISDFSVATNGNGGPEFYVTHTFTRVRPVSKPKACPIF